jgi:cell division protein FtsQ
MVSLGLFLAATTALFYIFISPAFYIQTVAVEGNTILDDHVVAGLVELESDWIWFIDKQQLIAQIKQNAYVEHAALELALPNRAVIHVSERRPEVRWLAGGTEYLVDGGGRVLDVARASEVGTLVIVDHSNPALQPNQYIDPDALKLAQSLAVRLPNELRFPPQLIGWDVALGIYIISPYGQTIVFGRSERLESKLAILNQLLIEDVRFSYLDLRPTYPYYRP